jgi:hypothetical protein
MRIAIRLASEAFTIICAIRRYRMKTYEVAESLHTLRFIHFVFLLFSPCFRRLRESDRQIALFK